LLEFILVMYLETEKVYIGTFESCNHAERYIRENLPPRKVDYGCLHRNFIHLPKDLKEKYIFYRNNLIVNLEGNNE